MSPAVQEKLIWTVLAVGIYMIPVWPPAASLVGVLYPLAGLIVGKAWLQSVDEKHAARARASVPPEG